MPTFHILSQYIWPDAGPDGLYAEQLAARLHQHGCDVCLVGGKGSYRPSGREKPELPLIHLDHYCGRRGDLAQTFIEYCAVKRAFHHYIARFVREGDVAVVTSAPPTTVQLAKSIQRRGARAIYWLQDYYPELIRAIREYPRPFRRAFGRYWDGQLSKWNRVVKIGANLGGPLHNSVLIRNWPTLKFEESTQPEPLTALYSGNLSYGHDIGLLVAACEKLRDEGYRISIRADGRGVCHLPAWLKARPLHSNPEELKNDLIHHEVHLVAAHPRITRAMFPSRIWNSIAAGRRLLCTGFTGEMATELQVSKNVPFERHLDEWTTLLVDLANSSQGATSGEFDELPSAARELQPTAIG
jgi:glycosyltransferase involved in cell wall biosynthesis